MKKKKATIRIQDEVNAVILGLSDDDLLALYDRFAVPTENYFFNPKFKLGQWDGKIRYFHKTGKTYVYLLEEVVSFLMRHNYTCVVDDLRKADFITPDFITDDIFADILHPDTEKPTILREHQVNAVNTAIEHGNGVIVAATSAGKTLICAALCKAYEPYGIKTLTIVPNKDLIAQTRATYHHYNLDVGEYSGERKDIEHQHVVSTWQALKNNDKIVPMFNMVIVDECHGVKGDQLSKILTAHAKRIPYRFGFTGTLPKGNADLLSVHVAIGPKRYEVGAVELIQKGVLSNLDIDVVQLEENLIKEYTLFKKRENINISYTKFKNSYFPDFTSEKQYLQRNPKRLHWIVNHIQYLRDNKRGNVLCLVDSIAFARKIASRIPNAICINGKDVKSPKDRKDVYDLFKDNDDVVVIATVNIAGVGLSINRIFNMVFIDLGKSFIRVIQAVGRGLRKAKDKDHVNITDICSDLKYGKKHVRIRMNYYTEQQYPHKKRVIDYSKQISETLDETLDETQELFDN